MFNMVSAEMIILCMAALAAGFIDAIVGGGGGGGVGTHTHTTVAHEHLIEDREIITVEEGTQVIIFAANRYTPSSGEIKVWINGQLVRSGYAFTESGVDRVTMTGLPIKTGDWFYAEITKAATLTSSNEVEP